MEAGNRCFDLRVPEEINRKIVDHISDINLTYSEHARRYLMAEGIKPETIMVTGSPMREVLEFYKIKIETSNIIEKMKLDLNKYFVVSAHREENIESETNFKDLIETLNVLAESYGMPIIVSTHPRTRKKLENLPSSVKLDQRISFLKPLGFLDYVRLQMDAFCVLSDSGTITEESSILNFPAVTIREAHERPEGMDEGVLIMCGLKEHRVMEAVKIVTDQFSRNKRLFRMVNDYKSKNVSEKVVRIIASYTDYVNRIVWQKTL